MAKKITIIGSGISSLACAAFLAKAGNNVTILEKNETIGGRARKFSTDGFTFDMGPSWYWMPQVFEKFYNQFGHTSSDFYELVRLDPSYRIFWEDDSHTDLPANLNDFYDLFESIEEGSAEKLKKFLKEAAYKYDVGMNDLVYRPGLKLSEFADIRILKGFFKMHLTQSFSTYIRKYFKHPKILSLLEFPILFLGAMPQKTPALYSLMNYADIELGTWYPKGGMYKIIEAFEKIAREQGVKIQTTQEVNGFQIKGSKITEAHTATQKIKSDFIISGADYHHTDKELIGQFSNYSENYWDKRQMAPSSLLFFLGINKKIDHLLHHNLFFDTPFGQHAKDIYESPEWPASPLFYACCPSKTDTTVAPAGCENLFLLIPLAPDLKDSEKKRETYLEILLDRLEKHTKTSIREHIVYQRSFCIDDFKKDYHAYKGNAYGLANTLKQTAIFKPGIRNKNISNLFYTGQLTVPGPGVPPAIISGEVVAREVLKTIEKNNKSAPKPFPI